MQDAPASAPVALDEWDDRFKLVVSTCYAWVRACKRSDNLFSCLAVFSDKLGSRRDWRKLSPETRTAFRMLVDTLAKSAGDRLLNTWYTETALMARGHFSARDEKSNRDAAAEGMVAIVAHHYHSAPVATS